MLERTQKPFLTVETGEAYQPIRLTYQVLHKEKLSLLLDNLQCLEKKSSGSWNWYWKAEADELPFESIDSFQRNATHPLRLGSFTLRDDKLYLNLASFKRACLAVPFFHRVLDPQQAKIQQADFLNKVYGLEERLPHGFSELFKEDELQLMLDQRMEEYQKAEQRCEQANSMEEAFSVLSEYTEREAHKKLPFAERYEFDLEKGEDPDLIFLGFYIFLRGRELVAMRRWFGETGYTLANAVDEAIEQIFGSVGVDIID